MGLGTLPHLDYTSASDFSRRGYLFRGKVVMTKDRENLEYARKLTGLHSIEATKEMIEIILWAENEYRAEHPYWDQAFYLIHPNSMIEVKENAE